MSGQQQTREPKIPGQIPKAVQELSGAGVSTIYELSSTSSNKSGPELPSIATRSTIYELSGTGLNKSSSEISSVQTPSEFLVPEIPSIGFWDNWIDMPLQQQGDGDGKGDPETLVGTSAVPEPVSFSNAGPGKPTKTITRDPAKPNVRKKSRTGVTTASDKIVVAVFGLTGTGKSNFIRKLTGQDVEIGHGLQSCEHAVDTIYQSTCN